MGMEREPWIKRVVISDEGVTENGEPVCQDQANFWRQKIAEENEIWNGHHNGSIPQPEIKRNQSMVPDHIVDRQTGILHLSHDEFMGSLQRIHQELGPTIVEEHQLARSEVIYGK